MHAIQSAASSESQPTREDSTMIAIGADQHPSSNRLHGQRLFRLPLSPSATSTTREIQPPPSYEEANNPNGITINFLNERIKVEFVRMHSCHLLLLGPPPSYDSLFGRVREVRKTSRGFVDFIKNLFFFLLGKSNITHYRHHTYR